MVSSLLVYGSRKTRSAGLCACAQHERKNARWDGGETAQQAVRVHVQVPYVLITLVQKEGEEREEEVLQRLTLRTGWATAGDDGVVPGAMAKLQRSWSWSSE